MPTNMSAPFGSKIRVNLLDRIALMYDRLAGLLDEKDAMDATPEIQSEQLIGN